MRKPGTKQVTLNIDPELRAEVMRLTGARTLTEAVHEALADLVLGEREVAPLRRRREIERKWVAEMGLGLSHPSVTLPEPWPEIDA